MESVATDIRALRLNRERVSPSTPWSDEMDIPSPVISSLVASGFPFQTAVANAVRQVNGWQLVGQELPWRDDDSSDQFLDIVATNGLFVVTLECKKTQKETLTFLRPGSSGEKVTRTRCLYLQQIQDSTKRMELFCSDCWLAPSSAESMFCIVSTSDSGKDQRLLERDAQRLMRATDAYAFRYRREFKVKMQTELNRYIVPLIVTNAKLFVAQYNPTDISLETGQFSMPPPATIVPVERVRFRKAFTSLRGRDLGDRTVMVVSSTGLLTFLSNLDVTESAPSEEGKVHFQEL
jgi:hypothetical protein